MAAVSSEQFLARLAKGKPVPALLLLGTEAYLRDLCRRKIVESLVPPEMREWGVVRFSAEQDAPSAILAQAQTHPMLAQVQVIVIADTQAWQRAADSRDDPVEQLAAYLADPAPFSVLVFEAAALDQRMRLAKLFAERALVVDVELSTDPLRRAELAAPLAVEMAREMGVRLDQEAAAELADALNGDLQAMRTELEKLATYAGQSRHITGREVAELVVSAKKSTTWDLVDVLAARDTAGALQLLDRLLREGEQPVALIGAVAWMYRRLLEARDLPAALPERQAAARIKMRPEAAVRAVQYARKFSRAQLAEGLVALYEADSSLKSGAVNKRAVMEFLVARLSAFRAADHAGTPRRNPAPKRL